MAHEDGVVFLNTADGRILSSNRAGSFLWKAIGDHAPVDIMASELSRVFHLSLAQAVEDTLAFVEALTECGLLLRESAR